LTAIPYFAWDHREPSAMAVWVRQQGLSKTQPDWSDSVLYKELRPEMLTDEPYTPEAFVPVPLVMASHHFPKGSINAIIDGKVPKNSGDLDIPRFTFTEDRESKVSFWDPEGTLEWIVMDLGAKKKVSKSSIYWVDDAGKYRIPKSWSLYYRVGGVWKPLKTVDAPKKDAYDVVEFDAVETTALRIEIQLQVGVSGGVLEWKVE
jgi:hypothetical protein